MSFSGTWPVILVPVCIGLRDYYSGVDSTINISDGSHPNIARVLASKAFFELRSSLKALKLYDWLCFDGGWNEEATREFYSSSSLSDGDEKVITWTCHDVPFSFGIQDISLAIGVPCIGRTLEEILAEIAIFARATQTNLLPMLNLKIAMRRHSLLLTEAVKRTSLEMIFDIPKIIFREMIKVMNYLFCEKRTPVIGYPFTITRLMMAKGMLVREPDHHIYCYGLDVIYPVDSAVELKMKMYSSQCKMKQQQDQKMEEVLDEVRYLKDFVSDIHRRIEVTNMKSKNKHASESVSVEVQENPPSPIHAKTGRCQFRVIIKEGQERNEERHGSITEEGEDCFYEGD